MELIIDKSHSEMTPEEYDDFMLYNFIDIKDYISNFDKSLSIEDRYGLGTTDNNGDICFFLHMANLLI